MTLLVKVSCTLSIEANFSKWRPAKDIKYKNFSFRGFRIKNYITLDFRDSTLTYVQESIFSPTNHRAIVWLADQSHFHHLETNLDCTSVTRKKYRLVRGGNGQLSTRTRVILLWAQPVVGLRPTIPGLRPVLVSKPYCCYFYPSVPN